MRVAYLVSMKRGLPVFTYREVKLLRERGVDVHLYVMRDGKGVAMPELEWPVVKIRINLLLFRHLYLLLRTPQRYLSGLWEAFREDTLVHFAEAAYFLHDLRASGVDVIYCNEGKHALWIAYYIRCWLPLPIVVHAYADMVTARTHFSITKRASDLCSKFIVESEYTREKLVERYGLPEEMVEVVRFWSPYSPDRRIKIMIVGEWSERKAHEVVLDAFEQLDPERYVLWVVGGGTWSGEYYDVAAEVKRRRLEDRVVIWGRVPEEFLKVLYQSCDIFTLPSRTTKQGITEGIPVSLMEAMSYGRPVVSTYHAAIPELVEEILVEENNAEQLREAFEGLGDDPKLRERLGKRNLEIIRERFSEKNVAHIESVLAEAVKGKVNQR